MCVILSSGGCVFMSCGLSYLNVECRDEVRVMSYVVGDLVCGILSYVVCVLMSCALYYEMKYV